MRRSAACSAGAERSPSSTLTFETEESCSSGTVWARMTGSMSATWIS